MRNGWNSFIRSALYAEDPFHRFLLPVMTYDLLSLFQTNRFQSRYEEFWQSELGFQRVSKSFFPGPDLVLLWLIRNTVLRLWTYFLVPEKCHRKGIFYYFICSAKIVYGGSHRQHTVRDVGWQKSVGFLMRDSDNVEGLLLDKIWHIQKCEHSLH